MSYIVDAGEDQSICFGQTATVTGKESGTWSEQAGNPGTATITSPNSASTTITGFSAAGVYTFVRTFNGCTDLVTVTVAGGGPGAITASLTQPSCQILTGSATISSAGAVLYAFDGAAYQASNSISNLAPGTHFVYTSTATSAGQVNSCNQAGPFTFTIGPVPSPPAAPIITAVNPTCAVLTGSVLVTSPLGGVSYSLAGAATGVSGTGSFTGLAAASGPYTVTASMNGCTSAVSNAVSIGASAEVVNAGADQSICFGQPATITGTGSGTWSAQTGNPGTATITSPNSASTTITGFSAAGVYTFVRTFNGCTDLVTVTVAGAGPGAITASLTQPSCQVPTGSAVITSAGAVLYAFDGAAYQASNSISNLAPGPHFVYTSTATLAGQVNSCNQAGPFTFTIAAVPPSPAKPVITAVNPTCQLLTGSVLVSSPLGGVSYSLAGAGTAVSATGSFTGLAAGSGPYTVTASMNGCTSAISNAVSIGAPATGCVAPCEPNAGTIILIP